MYFFLFFLYYLIENEKQELLLETQGLMSQITETTRDHTTIQAKYDEIKKEKELIQEQYDINKAYSISLNNDIKNLDQIQHDLKIQLENQQVTHRESIERMEILVKDSKKTASQQIIEISQNFKVSTSCCYYIVVVL